MVTFIRRQASLFKWLVVVFFISAALLTVTLRVFLPNLDEIKAPLQKWANGVSGFELNYQSASGYWHLFAPSLYLHDFSLNLANSPQTILTAKSIRLNLDLWASVKKMSPIFSNVAIDGLQLDLTQPLVKNQDQDIDLKDQLEKLFLIGLGHFSVRNSQITLLSLADKPEVIEIDSLSWDSQFGKHHVQGVLSVQGTSLNQVKVKGDFSEKTGLSSLDGHFYLSVENVSLINWISEFLREDIKIEKARVDGKIWLTVENGLPQKAQLSIKKSHFLWSDISSSNLSSSLPQELQIQQGSVFLQREGTSTWTVTTDNLKIETDQYLWPDPDIKMRFSSDQWLVNIAKLDLFLLQPLADIFALPKDIKQAIISLFPKGKVKDIRLLKNKEQPLAYSASFHNVSFNHWSYFPQVNQVNFSLMGKGKQGQIKLNMKDEKLPYGDFFQAPLDIKKADVVLYWTFDKKRWLLWSDKIAVRSSALDILGSFSLDIPYQGSPWLSFYAEANLADAGKTWQYLPSPALGDELTDYLSTAIRGGQVEHAKLLWSGAFTHFPYVNNQGVFQAFIPIKQGIFSFDTNWPELTDLDLDLFFENDALFLEASNVNLMGARGFDLKGQIPSFQVQHPLLTIDSSIVSSGKDLREYMLATPLVDSVGAAMNYINVQGDIGAKISLAIPMNGDDVTVKGEAKLDNNQVSIARPNIQMQDVTGSISFENDVVNAKAMSATLLEQKVEFGFNGETESNDYLVNVDMAGDWHLNKLKAALNLNDASMIEGQSDWDFELAVALKDIGFTYLGHLNANLTNVDVDLPDPLKKPASIKSQARLDISGDAQRLAAKIKWPNFRYRAEIDIDRSVPKVIQSQMMLGDGMISRSPILGNVIDISYPTLDLIAWGKAWDHYQKINPKQDKSAPIIFQAPSRINVKADKILIDEFALNNFSLSARNKNGIFKIVTDSEELAGYAWWDFDKHLSLSIKHLFLNVDLDKNNQVIKPKNDADNLSFEHQLMSALPSMDVIIDDLWLQGYKLGKVDIQLVKSKQQLNLTHLSIDDGGTKINGTGLWEINNKGLSKTALEFYIKGIDSSDLLGRFAVIDGIQGARFMSKANLSYLGAPWSMQLDSLNGNVEVQLSKGFVSGVGGEGAGKVLGLFSLDSILRKIQLDFSGIFDDGLAFDKIIGNASISNGILVTDNIEMKALAGDMYIKGIANLVENKINAQVRFVPDLTSGLPVLTAFAIAPQTALYVLAVTTVITPVVDAFVQVRYQVSGPIDDPIIREISRSTGEVILPQKATERLRSEQKGRTKQ